MSDDRRWLSVEAAAKEVGIPARTIYNWVRSKRLVAKKDGKRLLVEIGAVRSLAATRVANDGALPEAGIAGTGAGNHAKSGKLARAGEVDGELAGRAIALLEEGAGPLELVTQLGMSMGEAVEFVTGYKRLKQMQAKDKPQEDRVAKLEAAIADLRRGVNNLSDELREQDARHFVNRLEERLRRFEALFRSERCQRCGGTLFAVLPVSCDHCAFRYERPVEPRSPPATDGDGLQGRL